MKNFLLDTSALITLQSEEAGSEIVEELLKKALNRKVKAYVSFVTWTEIFYITSQRFGHEKAVEVLAHIKCLPIQRIDPDEETLVIAGELKAIYPLSLADSYVAATCLQTQSTLIHKDPEFESLKEKINLLSLPYKKIH